MSWLEGTVEGKSVPSTFEKNTRVHGAGQNPLVP